ncbi:ATP-binding protein [Deinococcus sp.]|uniref:sensor histidine kinase n=1 Tax=Deinococcus sp. TaxID=47478 RepID=UPI003B5A8B03
MTGQAKSIGEQGPTSEQVDALAAFAHFAELSVNVGDVPALASRAAQVLRSSLGEISAAYYEPEGELWRARAWSDDITLEVVTAIRAGIPQDAPSFAEAVASRSPLFVAGWNAEAESIGETREYGAVALYPYFTAGQPIGILVIGTQAAREWTQRERTVFGSVGRSLGLALERAEQGRALRERTEALDAFVRFAEASAASSELGVLAREAFTVLETYFPDATCGLYELERGGWGMHLYSDHLPPAAQAIIETGLPLDTPLFSGPLERGEAEFIDDWQALYADANPLFRTTGAYPVVVGGQVVSFLAIWLRQPRPWQERDKAIVRAVSRSLTLALERAAALEALRNQQGELEARSRALEAFTNLLRDLTVRADAVELVRRAQEVVMSMLPDGCALYYQLESGVWFNVSQVGDLGNPELQAVIDAGLPYETTQNLTTPWQTQQPYYQDRYDQTTDALPELTTQIGSTATLPVLVAGEPVGVFVVALFGSRPWQRQDQAILEAVVGSLGLALGAAQSVLNLRDRSTELERSNSDLEQFAYVASHDLQEPLRTITSFAQLLVGRYRGQLDDKADNYLAMIEGGTARMGRLLQDLLTFSRVTSSAQLLRPVDLNRVISAVQSDLHDQISRSQAEISVGELPSVMGDATQLRQLFQNLIGNAVKFSVPGRAVRVNVSAEQIGVMQRLTVSDNGIGIAPEFQERIFTIFQRLHSREAYEGSGIGLAVARKIVERHGGEIGLDSVLGEGTTFWLTLPVAERDPRQTHIEQFGS